MLSPLAETSSTPDAPAAQTSATTRSARSRSIAGIRIATRLNSCIALLFGCLILAGAPGCYYGHLAAGQARLLWASRPIDEVLRDPQTGEELRSKLELVHRARDFARELGLEVEDQYTSYVAWPGDRVITSVVATRPGEIEPTPFRFPIIGRAPYKGFFDLERAEAEAARLEQSGLDVCTVPVAAYSTLGWLDDPVTAPMLLRSEGEIAETVIHELVHATAFVESEPDFNEGVANFVGQEAAVRFFAGDPSLARAQRERIADARLLARIVLGFQRRVGELYEGSPDSQNLAPLRSELEAATREQLASTQFEAAGLDAIRLSESIRLNDACLALRGTYAADLEDYQQTLAALDGDLRAFVTRLREAARASDPRAAFSQLDDPN